MTHSYDWSKLDLPTIVTADKNILQKSKFTEVLSNTRSPLVEFKSKYNSTFMPYRHYRVEEWYVTRIRNEYTIEGLTPEEIMWDRLNGKVEKAWVANYRRLCAQIKNDKRIAALKKYWESATGNNTDRATETWSQDNTKTAPK